VRILSQDCDNYHPRRIQSRCTNLVNLEYLGSNVLNKHYFSLLIVPDKVYNESLLLILYFPSTALSNIVLDILHKDRYLY
jgi:hypothetical protein